jgi:hypothetical protein
MANEIKYEIISVDPTGFRVKYSLGEHSVEVSLFPPAADADLDKHIKKYAPRIQLAAMIRPPLGSENIGKTGTLDLVEPEAPAPASSTVA